MYLPPLGPSSNPSSSSLTPNPRMMLQRCENGFKMRKLNDDGDGKSAIQMTNAEENELALLSEPEEAGLVPRSTEHPATHEGTQKVSAKENLYKLCGVKHWKAPVYECFDDNNTTRLFTVKATVEIKEDSRRTVLECFGDPQPKKKIAAEQAAEAALWYLKNVGHTLQTDKASARPRLTKPLQKIMATGEACNDVCQLESVNVTK